MKLRILPKIQEMVIEYRTVEQCPLCGSPGDHESALARTAYRFSTLIIPLPQEGVALMRCPKCDLLFKSRMPTAAGLANVMSRAAEDEWKPKTGPHPSIEQIRRYITGKTDILDIGASQGDLLRGLAPFAGRLSAFDIVAYERCREVVNAEYITGAFEDTLEWSRQPYEMVTAFDVFEHFLDTPRAVTNILDFVRPGGYLILETGDWRSVAELSRWYYCNLFEHQIFWSRRSLAYLCEMFGLETVECERVNHKYRRNAPFVKRAVITGLRTVGRIHPELLAKAIGIDTRLLPPPMLHDHLFAVLKSSAVANRAKPVRRRAGQEPV